MFPSLGRVCAILPALALALAVPTGTASGVVLPLVPARSALAGVPASSLPAVASPLLVAQACVDRLPLDIRIGQTMLVITATPAPAKKRLDQGLIAGMLSTGILSKATAKQFRDATTGAKYGAILGADEEGGLVQRYRRVIGSIPSAAYQSQHYTTAEVRKLYRTHGLKLRDWGVNVVFAPVADVGSGPGIGTRSYSSQAKVVAAYATAAADGLRDAGLLPTAKHFPGHGRTTADSHNGRSVGPGIASLRKVDLVPFQAVIDSGRTAVMVGHTYIPGYSNKPSSQSARTIGTLLRKELGFSGLVISDALGMAGSGQSSQGAGLVGFLRAGGDLGIVGVSGAAEGRKAVRAALQSGKLTQAQVNAAAARVFQAKGVDPCGLTGVPTPKPETAGPTTSDAPIVNPTKDS